MRGTVLGVMAPDADRRNNFDLLRLVAASEVLWVHTLHHLDVPVPDALSPLDWALRTFPGVPAFFVVSGYLVTDAWLRAPDPFIYARNRILRVYPALWACLGLSIALLLSFGHGPALVERPAALAFWLFAQASVLQVWNPGFLRGFGTGVLNGSLWTIPVELQFYAVLPLLVAAPRRTATVLFAGSAVLYAVIEGPRPLPTINRLVLVSLAPHLFCFGLGVAARRARVLVMPWLAGRLQAWLVLHLATHAMLSWAGVNALPWVVVATRPILAGLVLSAAFTAPDSAARWLRGTDLSYGLYLVHMPVLNAVIEAGGARRWDVAAGAMIGCYALAGASWTWIERPALRLKMPRARLAPPRARPG